MKISHFFLPVTMSTLDNVYDYELRIPYLHASFAQKKRKYIISAVNNFPSQYFDIPFRCSLPTALKNSECFVDDEKRFCSKLCYRTLTITNVISELAYHLE